MSDEEPFFNEEIYNIKNIYLEIIRGYSYDFEKDIYVKHFTDLERIQIIEKRNEIIEKIKIKGLRTEKEALKYIISENIWSHEKEKEIAELELKIEDNTRMANNMVVAAQKNTILKLVEKDKEELFKKRNERENLLGLTVEKYADNKYINYYLYFSFFKDSGLKQRYFSESDFVDLEDNEISDYFQIYSRTLDKFNESNFKKIAVTPFFVNIAAMAYEDTRLFLDKSVLDYTNYQLEIFNMAKRNVRVSSEANGDPPIIHSQTKYSQLIKWYDLQYATSETKRKEAAGQTHGVKKSINYV
jgi:hypothetical protein